MCVCWSHNTSRGSIRATALISLHVQMERCSQVIWKDCAAQPNGAFRNDKWTVINVVFGSICWLALTAGILMYISRSAAAKKQGKRWYGNRACIEIVGILETSESSSSITGNLQAVHASSCGVKCSQGRCS